MRVKKYCFFTILVVYFMIVAFTPGSGAKGNEEVRCHRCKEKDVSLVYKHKQIGFDGCLKCHTGILGKGGPEGASEKK